MPAQPLSPEQQADAARLKQIFEAKKKGLGLTQESLAARCGWESQGSVSQYLNGKIPLNPTAALKFSQHLHEPVEAFSPDLAFAIAQFRELSAGDLVFGGDIHRYPPPTQSVVELHEPGTDLASGYVRLEHLSPRPSMGHGLVIDEPVHVVRHLDVLERWLRDEVGSLDPRRIKILTAIGRSNLPSIKDRDLVFVDVGQQYFDAPGFYVLDVGGRFLLKKVLLQASGHIIIRSDNVEEFPDEERYTLERAADEITISGKVLAWWTLKKG
ncbi:LexA family transcriptional regulator [Thauera sp.]|uniref:LexA family transcriptional regulator n=1 Tax=Thauera sp. TaxID=1905334 RepID=UPI0039E461CC